MTHRSEPAQPADGTTGTPEDPEGPGRWNAPATRVLIVGDGPVTEALVPMVEALGWRPSVTTEAATLEEALPETGVVIVLSHHEGVDGPAIQAALQHGTHYIGAMGSRRTQQRRRAWLLEQGVPPDAVDSVHGPAGLDLGADTPGEIALSILAEAVAVRRGRSAEALGSLRGRTSPLHPGLDPGEATCPEG